MAQLRAALVYELADSKIIPFNIEDYAKALKNYATSIYNLSKKHDQQLRDHGVSFGKNGWVFYNLQVRALRYGLLLSSLYILILEYNPVFC